MDKELRKAKRRARKAFKKWLKPLGLLWWDIDIIYVDDYDDCRSNFGRTKRDFGSTETAMSVIAQWEYLSAQIEVNLFRVAAMTDDMLEQVVLHELCHILVNEMREGKVKHEERVCEALASAFRWTRSAGKGTLA